jgi:hypothetical protein
MKGKVIRRPGQKGQRFGGGDWTTDTYRIGWPGDGLEPMWLGDIVKTPDGEVRITSMTWKPLTQEQAAELEEEWDPEPLVCFIETEPV